MNVQVRCPGKASLSWCQTGRERGDSQRQIREEHSRQARGGQWGWNSAMRTRVTADDAGGVTDRTACHQQLHQSGFREALAFPGGRGSHWKC